MDVETLALYVMIVGMVTYTDIMGKVLMVSGTDAAHWEEKCLRHCDHRRTVSDTFLDRVFIISLEGAFIMTSLTKLVGRDSGRTKSF